MLPESAGLASPAAREFGSGSDARGAAARATVARSKCFARPQWIAGRWDTAQRRRSRATGRAPGGVAEADAFCEEDRGASRHRRRADRASPDSRGPRDRSALRGPRRKALPDLLVEWSGDVRRERSRSQAAAGDGSRHVAENRRASKERIATDGPGSTFRPGRSFSPDPGCRPLGGRRAGLGHGFSPHRLRAAGPSRRRRQRSRAYRSSLAGSPRSLARERMEILSTSLREPGDCGPRPVVRCAVRSTHRLERSGCGERCCARPARGLAMSPC